MGLGHCSDKKWLILISECHRHDGYFINDYCNDLCVGWSGGCCYNEDTKDCKNYVEGINDFFQYFDCEL